MKKFPFTSSFSAIVKPLVSEEKDKLLALASLDEVAKFLPNIDTKKNFDLLPVAFNACVVNRVNKNGDVIDTPTAIASYKEFINKPIDVEHNRQKVIGVILTAGFSKFGKDEPITEAEASKMTEPFNITLGGLVWKMVSPELAETIEESSDPTSDNFRSVSASWELGFSEYNVVLMDAGKKDLSQGQIVTDAKQIDILKDKLRALGGDGKDGDKFVYRMPKDVLPMGIGFTEKPAAEVKGIATPQTTQTADSEAQVKAAIEALNQAYKDVVDGKMTRDDFKKKAGGESFLVHLDKVNEEKSQLAVANTDLLNKISQNQNPNVKQGRNMKINSVTDITDENLKQTNASEISDFISKKLKEGSDIWENEKGKLNKSVTDSEAAAKAANTKVSEVQAELEKVQKTLAELQKEKDARAKVEVFNTYMAKLNEKYNFDDETRAAIVEDVKAIASDADFEKYEKKAAVIFKSLVKATENKENKENKDGKDAAAQAAVAAAIENGKRDGGLPNGSSANEPTLKEKYKAAFASDQFIIKKY